MKTLPRSINLNIRYFYAFNFFSGLIFTLPIWVMFERRFLTFSQMALLEVLASAATIILELPTGALADLIGRRRTILTGVLFYALNMVIMGTANSIPPLVISMIGIGVSNALISGADTALLYDTLKQTNQEHLFSSLNVKLSFLHRLGIIIGSLTGGFLYHLWVSLPYLLKAIAQTIGALFVFLMVEPSIDSEKFSLKNYLHQTTQGVKEIARSAYTKKLALFYLAIGSITWSFLYYFNQPFAMDFGYSDIQLGILFSGIFIVSSAILYLLTCQDSLLTRPMLYLGFPLLISASLIPGLFVPKALVPLLLLGIQVAGSGRFSILDRYVNLEFSSKNRATAISTLNMGVNLVFLVIVSAGGYLQDRYDTRLIATLLGFTSLIVTLPLAFMLLGEYQNYRRQKALALAPSPMS